MSGKDIFIEYLLRAGIAQDDIEETVEGVLFFPVDGILTGVDIVALSNFPQESPHWCHIPDDIRVASCYSIRNEPPVLPGYKKYSLATNDWGQPQSGEKNFSPIKAWKLAVRTCLYSADD